MIKLHKIHAHNYIIHFIQLKKEVCSYDLLPCLLTYLLIYLLTYLLTPCSRVFLEKLTGSAAKSRNPPHFWNPKVHRRTHKCLPPTPILSQPHSVPIAPSQLQQNETLHICFSCNRLNMFRKRIKIFFAILK